MEQELLKMLAQVVLPTQILDYFIVTGVEQSVQSDLQSDCFEYEDF